MCKSLKKLLTASSALLMIASVGVISSNTNVNARRRHVRAYRVYRHRSMWHYGVPGAIKGYWRSKLVRTNQYYHHGYVRDLVHVGSNRDGFNPFPFWYNARKHYKMNGATNGEFWHPHYKYYGHGKYVITSGDAFDGHSYSMKYIIRQHGHNHFSMWHWNEDNNSMDYGGYFNRAYSWHQWLRK